MSTQEIRRKLLEILFAEKLRNRAIKLTPRDISVKESWNSDFTIVDMAIEELALGTNMCREVKSEKSKGFVDGMFKACCEQYVEEHASLKNIELLSYEVKPKFHKSGEPMGSDAKTEVTLMVNVKDHGVAEFSCTSRSILYSSFVATLEAFQFYINCDKAFKKIKLILEDAQSRNREDIVQLCMSDLAMLTGVNTYGKE